MFELSNLKGITKKRKRIGRGGAKGGTAGKGNKGQKARSGAHIGAAFEGGQMPLLRRLPKRGFNNKRFQVEVKEINLQQLNDFFETGAVVNKAILVEKGLIKGRSTFVIKILGNGTLTKKLIVHADAYSKSAQEAIKSSGGEAHLVQEK